MKMYKILFICICFFEFYYLQFIQNSDIGSFQFQCAIGTVYKVGTYGLICEAIDNIFDN